MGGADEAEQVRDADALVASIGVGHLPRGGEVEDVRYVEPAGPTSERIAIGVTALVGGLLAAGVAFALVRLARPRWRPSGPAIAGTSPWRRLAITFLAPIAVYAGQSVVAAGLNELAMTQQCQVVADCRLAL